MKAIVGGKLGHVVDDFAGSPEAPMGGLIVEFADQSQVRVAYGAPDLIVDPNDRQVAHPETAARARATLSPTVRAALMGFRER